RGRPRECGGHAARAGRFAHPTKVVYLFTIAATESARHVSDTILPGLERRLKSQLTGEVSFDAFTRGRYATDASHYQIMPLGVVAPRTIEEARLALALAREEGVAVTPRGGGTSQCGQTVNSSVIVDCSKHLNRILELDVTGRR